MTLPPGKLACPYCSYRIDDSRCITGAAKVKPYDYSICLNCGGLARFDEGLSLLALDDQQAVIDKMDDEGFRACTVAQRAIRERGRIR